MLEKKELNNQVKVRLSTRLTDDHGNEGQFNFIINTSYRN